MLKQTFCIKYITAPIFNLKVSRYFSHEEQKRKFFKIKKETDTKVPTIYPKKQSQYSFRHFVFLQLQNTFLVFETVG